MDHAAESRPQMVIQSGKAFEPPERGPRKNDEVCAGRVEPLELADRRRVVGWRTRVFAVALEKGNGLPVRVAKLRLIHEDDATLRRNQRVEIGGRMMLLFGPVAKLTRGPIGFGVHRMRGHETDGVFESLIDQ